MVEKDLECISIWDGICKYEGKMNTEWSAGIDVGVGTSDEFCGGVIIFNV